MKKPSRDVVATVLVGSCLVLLGVSIGLHVAELDAVERAFRTGWSAHVIEERLEQCNLDKQYLRFELCRFAEKLGTPCAHDGESK
jgi:hypothetical protein